MGRVCSAHGGRASRLRRRRRKRLDAWKHGRRVFAIECSRRGQLSSINIEVCKAVDMGGSRRLENLLTLWVCLNCAGVAPDAGRCARIDGEVQRPCLRACSSARSRASENKACTGSGSQLDVQKICYEIEKRSERSAELSWPGAGGEADRRSRV
ncbi:hypothetical protein OH77DRAFT_99526 [Trametes cingulata]|nr:hypothetical protein OH77DRAFT_99526 [Trametes cingulata]